MEFSLTLLVWNLKVLWFIVSIHGKDDTWIFYVLICLAVCHNIILQNT